MRSVTKARRLDEGPRLELGVKGRGCYIRKKHQKKGKGKRKTELSTHLSTSYWQNPKGNQLAKELEKYRL